MKLLVIALTSASLLVLAGCGSTNSALAQKNQTVEYYRIFDIKATASKQSIAKAASKGMARNVNNVSEAMPIPISGEIPETPGRLTIVNPLAGNPQLAALAAGGGGSLGLRMASCEGASWTARGERVVSDYNSTKLTACLFQYKDGFHLDLYAVLVKKTGGLFQLSRSMADAVVGTPEEWTERTLLDIVRSIHSETGAEITLLEAQPEISGTPWLDGGKPLDQLK
ncbi:MAG: hypothetical protein FWH56_05600 [Betaproteobacteria bacterium]|nr:hypothetical protein [Betaproteobacteria bacterium]